MGRHDFHIVAVRHIRRGRIWGILSSALQNVPAPAACYRKLVLLWLRPARASAPFGYRSLRNVFVFDSGVTQSAAMAANGHCLQSRAVGILQIQIPVRGIWIARLSWRRADRFPFEIAAADRDFVLRIPQHQ